MADDAWVMISAALVVLMVPGLGLFYGALTGTTTRVGVQHALSHVVLCLVAVPLQWAAVGYGLAFGRDLAGLVGAPVTVTTAWTGASAYAPTVSAAAFVMFQGAFAALTAAIVYDAGAWRHRLTPAVILAWSTVVYDPVAHWVWADGGWLRGLGALDFAGGTVVHVVAGASVLAFALAWGRPVRHAGGWVNAEQMVLGTGLIWVGWFGFNGGSALAAGESAARAMLATHLAACAAAVAWRFAGVVLTDGPSPPAVVDHCVGAVAGLVAITPAAGYVGPLEAIVIGAAAGSVCRTAQRALSAALTDPMDVVAVHGVGGVVGALMTGLAAPGGGAAQVAVQAVAVTSTAAYAYLATWCLARVARYLSSVGRP